MPPTFRLMAALAVPTGSSAGTPAISGSREGHRPLRLGLQHLADHERAAFGCNRLLVETADSPAERVWMRSFCREIHDIAEILDGVFEREQIAAVVPLERRHHHSLE